MTNPTEAQKVKPALVVHRPVGDAEYFEKEQVKPLVEALREQVEWAKYYTSVNDPNKFPILEKCQVLLAQWSDV